MTHKGEGALWLLRLWQIHRHTWELARGTKTPRPCWFCVLERGPSAAPLSSSLECNDPGNLGANSGKAAGTTRSLYISFSCWRCWRISDGVTEMDASWWRSRRYRGTKERKCYRKEFIKGCWAFSNLQLQRYSSLEVELLSCNCCSFTSLQFHHHHPPTPQGKKKTLIQWVIMLIKNV